MLSNTPGWSEGTLHRAFHERTSGLSGRGCQSASSRTVSVGSPAPPAGSRTRQGTSVKVSGCFSSAERAGKTTAEKRTPGKK